MRQKTIHCGDEYREVDIFNYTEAQKAAVGNGKRSKKVKESEPKQKKLNDENARRYLVQLGNMNFGARDLHVTLTYDDAHLPETIEDAEKEVSNFLRRVAYRRKKEGLPALKYILVTAYSTEDEEELTRAHHHIIMNGGPDRDTVESLWSKPKKKGEDQNTQIGFVNADRLQPGASGIGALCTYLTRNPHGKKRWSSSRNLKRPHSRANDSRYTKKTVERLAKERPGREFWEKQYPGWTPIEDDYGVIYKHNDFTGWSIYLKLRRKRQ